MGIDESSARYRGFIELSSSQAETGAGFMVVSGGSGTWGHQASPECPQEQQRPGCHGGTAPGRKPELPGARAAALRRKLIFLLSRAEKTNLTPRSRLQREKLPALGAAKGSA